MAKFIGINNSDASMVIELYGGAVEVESSH